MKRGSSGRTDSGAKQAFVAALLILGASIARAGSPEAVKALGEQFGQVLSARAPRPVHVGYQKESAQHRGRRIGFMFGTFDPPHLGHLHAMEAAVRRLRLDLLVVAPNVDPSHKPHALPLEDRLAMTRLAVAAMPRVVAMPFLPSDVLVHRKQSVRAAAGTWLPGDECFWIVGGDWLESPARNPSLNSLLRHGYRIAVIERGGYHAAVPESNGGRVVFVAEPDGGDVSSTRIRAALHEEKSVEGMLSPAVFSYIRSHRLYADDSERERGEAPESAVLALP